MISIPIWAFILMAIPTGIVAFTILVILISVAYGLIDIAMRDAIIKNRYSKQAKLEEEKDDD